MYNVCINFEGHEVTGWAEFCGPYAECEGSEVISVSPENNDKSFMSRALSAVEDAAYKKYEEAHAGRSRNDDYDYEDTYTDYCSSRGGDYWQDPESGEYRCG